MSEGTRPTTATVLFTDMVGSSALRARLGEERADQVRSVHDALLAARVRANGGRVVKGTGDGIVAAFSSACDGLSAAVEMQQAIAAHNRRLNALAALSIRIGLSTGDVSWSGGDCFGTPLVEAARLEAAAEGGQILCSEYVRMMARGRGGHEFRRVGFLDLKGLPEPLATSEVLWAPGPEPGGVALPSELAAPSVRPFVGRSSELSSAVGILSNRDRKRLAVLWLLGEPGIGKTRLATEVARQAHAGGALVLFGRCNEDLPVPYQPFVEALRWFLAQVPDAELVPRLGAFAGELTRLVPELVQRLPGLEPTRSTSTEAEQHRLFEAVRSWLGAAGADRPLVAVFDDVHWADRPTLSLLGHVARSTEPSAAILVCTARNTSPDENPVLAELAGELERREAPSHRVELGGLAVDAVSELVCAATGDVLDLRLRTMAAEVHAETAGNPLFVDAVLTTLASAAGGPGTALPRSLAETVSRRVGRLPAHVADLLRVASVAGLDFDLRVAARAAGRGELEALESLEEASRAGLVEETAEDRYRFTHALVRSALRADLSRSRRMRVHLALGEAIESVWGRELDEHVPALAHHFFEAVPVAGAERAYRYALLAGDRATRLLSHQEAAESYGRALELSERLDQADATLRSELLIARGEAQSRAGDTKAALATLEAAADAASAVSEPERLGRAALAYETAGVLTGSRGPAAVDLLRRAEAALPRTDTRLRALTLASLSRALEFAGHQMEAIDPAEEGLAMSRRLGDEATLGSVLVLTSFPYMGVEYAHVMAARCRELMDLVDGLENDEVRVWAQWFTILSSGQLGDLDRFDELMVAHAPHVDRLHQPIWHHDLALVRHVRAMLRGDLELAEQQLEVAADLDERFQWGLDGVYGLAMFLLRREQGRLEGLLPMLRALVHSDHHAAVWRPGLAALYLALGMIDEARTEFEHLARDGFATFLLTHNRTLMLSFVAEVCCGLGDADRAGWFLDQLRPCQGRVLLWHQACLGPADRLLGVLASVAGRGDDAEPWLARGLELSRRIGSPLWTAHCLSDCADHVWSRDPTRAGEMRAEAARLCAEHGFAGLGRRLSGTVA